MSQAGNRSPTRPVEREGRAIAGKAIKFSAARKAALHQVVARRHRRGFVAERVVEQRASLTPGAEPWV